MLYSQELLIQINAFHLLDAKPLSEPMLDYIQFNPGKTKFFKIWIEIEMQQRLDKKIYFHLIHSHVMLTIIQSYKVIKVK